MLKFIKEVEKRYVPCGKGRRMGLYKCSCGKEKEICISNVNRGITKSCGCANIKQITELGKRLGKDRANYKHGMFGTRFYNIYYLARDRCNNPKTNNHKYYYDKGIRMEWECFTDFYNDMYKPYLKHCKQYGVKQTTIDRIDSSKNYNKDNCRWATYKEQAKEKVGKTYLINNLHK